jgi:hypothetical protein
MDDVKARLLDNGSIQVVIGPAHKDYAFLAAQIWARSGGKAVAKQHVQEEAPSPAFVLDLAGVPSSRLPFKGKGRKRRKALVLAKCGGEGSGVPGPCPGPSTGGTAGTPYNDLRGENPQGAGKPISRLGSKMGRKALDDMFARVSKPDGGFTYNPHTDSVPKEGMIVSPFPERSKGFDADPSPRDVTDYIFANEDMWADEHNHVGAWHDPETGRRFLDVSIVVDTDVEAKDIARKKDQKSYFDLATGKSVLVNPDATSGGAVKDWRNYGKHEEAEADAQRAVDLREHLGVLQGIHGQGVHGRRQGIPAKAAAGPRSRLKSGTRKGPLIVKCGGPGSGVPGPCPGPETSPAPVAGRPESRLGDAALLNPKTPEEKAAAWRGRGRQPRASLCRCPS